MDRPSVTAVVATALGGARLGRCLRSLQGAEAPPREILVSVAGPLDVSRGVPEEEAIEGPIRVILSPRPAHYGAVVNRGAAEASGDLLVILNDDTVVDPTFFTAIRAAACHGPALLQPRILLLDPSPTEGPAPRLDNTGHDLFPDGFNWARGRNAPDGALHDLPGTVGAVSGAAFACPRDTWVDLGGFDESLDAFGEDVDLSFRALRRGIPLRYVPTARVWHELGASYGREPREKVYWAERNRLRAATRSLPWPALLAMPFTTPARWAWLALGASGDDPRRRSRHAPAALAGLLAGLWHAPDALAKRAADRASWQLGDRAVLEHLWRERVRSLPTPTPGFDSTWRRSRRRGG